MHSNHLRNDVALLKRRASEAYRKSEHGSPQGLSPEVICAVVSLSKSFSFALEQLGVTPREEFTRIKRKSI